MGSLRAWLRFAAVTAALAGTFPAAAFAQVERVLDVQTAGHGEPELIFLSEPGAPGTGWDHVVARFEVAHRCHVVTPGAPGSSLEVEANAVAAYAHEQGLVHPVLVGQGCGGAVVVAVAVQAPTLPGRLVLVDYLSEPGRRLEAIRCPTLVLAALAGPTAATRRTIRRRYHNLPGARFVFSERAKHDFVAEDLDGFTNALGRWLADR